MKTKRVIRTFLTNDLSEIPLQWNVEKLVAVIVFITLIFYKIKITFQAHACLPELSRDYGRQPSTLLTVELEFLVQEIVQGTAAMSISMPISNVSVIVSGFEG